MNVYEKNNVVILEGVADFDPKHIFECGQCFRWMAEEDGSYTGVAKGKVINVSRENDTVYIKNSSLKDFNDIWKDYFDLNTDYTKIKNILKNMDEHLEKATEFGWGIRILRQDPWEMIISFIISSSNTHFPPLLRHPPQPTQSLTGPVPKFTISVSIPFLSSTPAISESAVKVHPASCGLPFKSNTFIIIQSFHYIIHAEAQA